MPETVPAKQDEIKELSFEIVREKGNTMFSFQVPTFLTELYKSQGGDIKTSEKWKGLKFYVINDLRTSDKYRQLLSLYRLFDNYGAQIIEGGNFNIAWLRTVEGSGKFIVPDSISYAEISVHAKNVMTFLKEYFEEYLREYVIKAKLTFEI